MPGVTRTAGSVVFPGGGPQVAIPAGISNMGPRYGGNSLGHIGNGFGQGRPGGGHGGRGGSTIVGVPYPVYVGGSYYDASYGVDPTQQLQQQQPNVVVVYPQQPPPVIINQYSPGDAAYPTHMTMPQQQTYQAPIQSQTVEPPAESTHYLIAFKDHTIYSAVAYWVEGDTLHYFTNGSTHNQVSVSLIDRDLTARLNKDSGVEVKLPSVR
jgi:hypothetical protein